MAKRFIKRFIASLLIVCIISLGINVRKAEASVTLAVVGGVSITLEMVLYVAGLLGVAGITFSYLDDAKNAVISLAHADPTAFVEMVKPFQEAAGGVGAAVGDVVDVTVSTLKDMFGSIKDGLSNFFNPASNVMGSAVNSALAGYYNGYPVVDLMNDVIRYGGSYNLSTYPSRLRVKNFVEATSLGTSFVFGNFTYYGSFEYDTSSSWVDWRIRGYRMNNTTGVINQFSDSLNFTFDNFNIYSDIGVAFATNGTSISLVYFISLFGIRESVPDRIYSHFPRITLISNVSSGDGIVSYPFSANTLPSDANVFIDTATYDNIVGSMGNVLSKNLTDSDTVGIKVVENPVNLAVSDVVVSSGAGTETPPTVDVSALEAAVVAALSALALELDNLTEINQSTIESLQTRVNDAKNAVKDFVDEMGVFPTYVPNYPLILQAEGIISDSGIVVDIPTVPDVELPDVGTGDLGGILQGLSAKVDTLSALLSSFISSVTNQFASVYGKQDEMTGVISGVQTGLNDVANRQDEMIGVISGVQTGLDGLLEKQGEMSGVVSDVQIGLDGVIEKQGELSGVIADVNTGLSGVSEKIDAQTQAMQDAITNSTTDAINGALAIDSSSSLDFDKLRMNANELMNKFPFCIPMDLYDMFASMVGAAQAPKFKMNFDGTIFGGYTWELDLGDSQYVPIVNIVRYFILIIFVIGLMSKTRDFIKW